jgi:hypothetical protein
MIAGDFTPDVERAVRELNIVYKAARSEEQSAHSRHFTSQSASRQHNRERLMGWNAVTSSGRRSREGTNSDHATNSIMLSNTHIPLFDIHPGRCVLCTTSLAVVFDTAGKTYLIG